MTLPRSTRLRGSRAAFTLGGLAGLGLLLAGCGGSSQQAAAPQPQAVRSAVETAPADLQLMCASEAAKVYSAPANKILPVASSRSSATTYAVDLNVDGKSARCTIDDTGTSITVEAT